jgi:dTDP-glucose pyrophosphorylase
VNSDQVIRTNINVAIHDFRQRKLDAALLTFHSTHPRWSYVRTQEDEEVIEASEKNVISNLAIAGFYYFNKGRDFIEAAENVLLNGMEVKGAYYISQVINEVVLLGKKVSHYTIPTSSYFNLYSPQKVTEYEEL